MESKGALGLKNLREKIAKVFFLDNSQIKNVGNSLKMFSKAVTPN